MTPFDVLAVVISAVRDWIDRRRQRRLSAAESEKQLADVEMSLSAWGNERFDEWDERFKAETSAYPPFSRLAIEQKRVAEAKATAEHRANRKNTGDFAVYENCRVINNGNGLRFVSDARTLHDIVRDDAERHLFAAPNPFLPSPELTRAQEVERYQQLMRAQGIENWQPPEGWS